MPNNPQTVTVTVGPGWQSGAGGGAIRLINPGCHQLLVVDAAWDIVSEEFPDCSVSVLTLSRKQGGA